MNLGAYKQQECISHSCRGQEVQGHVTGRFNVRRRLVSWLIHNHLLTVTSHNRRGGGTLLYFFYKDTNKATPRGLPKASPNTITLWIGLQRLNFGGTQTLRPITASMCSKHMEPRSTYLCNRQCVVIYFISND